MTTLMPFGSRGIAMVIAVLSMAAFAPLAETSPLRTRDTDMTFTLRQRAGPYYYWRDRSVGKAYTAAVAAFGAPTSRGKDAPTSNLCIARWESVGLDVGFAGPVLTCSDRYLHRAGWFGMRLWGAGWTTARGLRVGDPIRRITALYRKAWYRSEPPDPGEWVLVSRWSQDFGRVPLLIAEVGAGRVIAIQVPAGFVF